MAGNTGFAEQREGGADFFQYWDSLGFFENVQSILPPEFLVLFQIARTIFSEEVTTDAFDAIEELSKEEQVFKPDRKESIQVNRLERIAPVSDRMELDMYKKIYELKKALPRELAWESEVFDMKLFTKTLMVQKFYETEADSFKPISTSRDQKGKDANRFEQKFYILLDRSKSMEVKMRTFYSKCVVAEFLRRKLQSKAKLYYRPFDSKPGKLFKIEKKEDFSRLIEEVLFTTTGGKSTNIEAAVNQAISDIRYDKEMMKAEILIVTDGISKINKNKMKQELKEIRLNVLKIGDEIPEPDFFDIENGLKNERINFDPTSINIRDIHKKVIANKGVNNDSELTLAEKRVYRFIFDFSDKMFRDLKEVSNKFIEIKDIEPKGLYTVSDDTLAFIRNSIDRFDRIDISNLSLDDKTKIFKQVHFLSQYVQMLVGNGNEENRALNQAGEKLVEIKQRLMKDPDVLITFMEVKELKEEKELMKLAKKEAKKMMKQMQLQQKKLSMKEMKKGQLIFSMDVGGEGSMGQFLLLMFIKLMQFLKRIVIAPFRKGEEKKKKG